MKINFDKTKILAIGTNAPTGCFDFVGTPIEIVKSLKILGVHVDRNLNFISHIQNLSASFSPILGILNKNKRNLNYNLRLKIYTGILLPKLTYALTPYELVYYKKY